MDHYNENNKKEKILAQIYEDNLDKIVDNKIPIAQICNELCLDYDEVFDYIADNQNNLLIALKLSEYLSKYHLKEGSDKSYGKRKDSH